MKNKLVFRILGALASALIIISVFVPFISVTGYSTSLWETFEVTKSLYLPIMIIVFGAIGVIFFALNIKTEFAYMSTGAIIFFLVMQTIDVLNQGVFNTLSLGYYFLAAGAILTGVMAFLTNLKTNKKEVKTTSAPVQTNEPSMIDQIDKLYNDQNLSQNQVEPIQPISNVVEPIPVQPIQTIQPVQPQPTLEQTQVIQPVVEPVVQQPEVQVQPNVAQPINPVVQEIANQQPVVEPVVQQSEVQVQPNVAQPINPAVQEFANPQPVNPVLQEFGAPVQQPVENVQPVIQQPIEIENTNQDEPTQPNPVVEEFANPSASSQNNTPGSLDIFGQ